MENKTKADPVGQKSKTIPTSKTIRPPQGRKRTKDGAKIVQTDVGPRRTNSVLRDLHVGIYRCEKRDFEVAV